MCPICLSTTETPTVTKCCGQMFCSSCLDTALSVSPYCPTCRTPLRKITGNQPPGTMSTSVCYHIPPPSPPPYVPLPPFIHLPSFTSPPPFIHLPSSLHSPPLLPSFTSPPPFIHLPSSLHSLPLLPSFTSPPPFIHLPSSLHSPPHLPHTSYPPPSCGGCMIFNLTSSVTPSHFLDTKGVAPSPSGIAFHLGYKCLGTPTLASRLAGRKGWRTFQTTVKGEMFSR